MPDLLEKKNKIESPKKVDTSVYHLDSSLKKSKSRWWWPTIILGIVILLIGLGFITKIILAINSTNSESGEKISFFEQIKHLLVNPEEKILGEAEDRINILLAGIGGPGHQGAYLADTIIVASFKPSTKEVATISIPRDLYVDIPEFGWRKINNALAFGHTSDYPGGGEALLSEVVEDVIGLPIHYYARVDFEGFRQAIDDVGGIDIMIDNSFTDYQYPDYNFGYQTITFQEGFEHMAGERALQFVRSRHGTSGEGSDFARSARQQKVIFALRDEVMSVSSLINPTQIISALDSLGEHNRTNLQVWEIVKLAKIAKSVSPENIITQVLETGVNGQLVSETTIDGAYILKPKAGDYSEIHYITKNIFNTSFIAREKARIEIQNSTSEPGLASKTADKLKGLKYNVVNIGNTDIGQPLTKTTIYDLSSGAKPYTVISLKNILQASVSTSLPSFITKENPSLQALNPPINGNLNPIDEEIDILIIIGNDQTQSSQQTAYYK